MREGHGEFRDFYVQKKGLGEGAFGQVLLCEHKASKDLRAVKKMAIDKLDQEEQMRLIYEIETLRTLDHPSIVRMYEFFKDKKNIYIITELCQGGELFDAIIAK